MANEFKHSDIGTQLTKAEWEGVGTHVLASQATGDIIYASSSSQLTRLGIGSTGQVLKVTGGVPAWGTDTTNVAASALTGTTMAANVVASSLTSVGTLTSLALSGNITLADSDKIVLGTGSDLEIYHDGSNSYISDQGTGNIAILANDFQVNNAANNANMISGTQGGAVALNHNGSTKFATTATGVAVTGRLTATDDI